MDQVDEWQKKPKPHICAILVICGVELPCLTDPEIKGNGCQKAKACYGLGCLYSSEPECHLN